MDYPSLIAAISDAHEQAQTGAAGAVNRYLVLRNWLIGAYLIEFEQSGEDRAKYGAGLLKRVAADLRERAVKGCSTQMLERMRLLYSTYRQIGPEISSSPMRISNKPLILHALPISSPLVRKSSDTAIA